MNAGRIHGPPANGRRDTGRSERLYKFLLADGTVRGAILEGTAMVRAMRSAHELGILETLVLGRALLGTALMSADLKGNDRVKLKIDCSGPIRGLVAEAQASGQVRGYLERVPIPMEKPMENYDLSPFFGAVVLSVTRHLEGANHPFTGQVILKYGNIAQDLAYYYLTSEQVPTAFNLSIKFDRAGRVTGAGGLLLQAMPKADEDVVADLEERVVRLPSLGEVFTARRSARDLVLEVFQQHSPRILARRPVAFACGCNKERLRSLLTLLPIDELKDMRDNGPFPLEMRCRHCNAAYTFSRKEIQAIYGRRYPNN